ncbi:hypothetical protein AAMO2058_001397900 [Amorphochlora amoebiformis]|eukprot:1354706-Amorphochlora_amoeboformis.AAC.1
MTGFQGVSLTKIKNYGGYLCRQGKPGDKRQRSDPTEMMDLTRESKAPSLRTAEPAAQSVPDTAPKKAPATNEELKRQMVRNEFAHLESICIEEGDLPFIIYSDPATSDAKLEGLSMWFNKGSDYTDIDLNIIHKIRMVHVQRTKQPPKPRTFRELKRDILDVAQSIYHGFKKQKLLPQEARTLSIASGFQKDTRPPSVSNCRLPNSLAFGLRKKYEEKK